MGVPTWAGFSKAELGVPSTLVRDPRSATGTEAPLLELKRKLRLGWETTLSTTRRDPPPFSDPRFLHDETPCEMLYGEKEIYICDAVASRSISRLSRLPPLHRLFVSRLHRRPPVSPFEMFAKIALLILPALAVASAESPLEPRGKTINGYDFKGCYFVSSHPSTV